MAAEKKKTARKPRTSKTTIEAELLRDAFDMMKDRITRLEHENLQLRDMLANRLESIDQKMGGETKKIPPIDELLDPANENVPQFTDMESLL